MGPGDPEYLTFQAADALRKAQRLILRTGKHRAAAWLEEQGIAYSTLDDFYDRYDNFDIMHQAMVDMIRKESLRGPLAYAVADPSNDCTVQLLRRDATAEDTELIILPGVSLASLCLARSPIPWSVDRGCRCVPAYGIASLRLDPDTPLLVTELDNPALAGDVKLKLTDLYDDEQPVVFFPSTARVHRKPLLIPLCEADRQNGYDHTACLLVPCAPLRERKRFGMEDLQDIMEILRDENGCPWDKIQTHETLRPYLLEEAYEAVGAIDESDMDHLADELGDVLLQIVFHASIGQSRGEFNFHDITTGICRKMFYRHAHIFGNMHCDTADEVSASWEQLKKAEKGLVHHRDVLADVSKALPALTRADKVQKKAAAVGFDWKTAADALPKVLEEAEELRREFDFGSNAEEELGDLLFSCVNVARLAGINAERALEMATDKFICRFSEMEKLVELDGKSLEDLTLEQMDVYWTRVKQRQTPSVDAKIRD